MVAPMQTHARQRSRSILRSVAAILLLGALAVAVAFLRRDRLPSARAVAPEVYVALGASDAVGVGATRPAQDGWVPLVAADLPTGTQLVNLGISGARIGDVSAGQLPVASDAAPRWVTLWPGPNDLRNGVPLATFTAQLDHVLAALRPAPGQSRTIAVLNLPDLRSLPVFAQNTDRGTLDARVREWNAAIAEVVGRHAPEAVLVDLYGGWAELAAHPEYISGDGFHPSSAGYRRIAEVTLAALRQHDPAAFR